MREHKNFKCNEVREAEVSMTNLSVDRVWAGLGIIIDKSQRCLIYCSVAVLEHHDQDNLQKEGVLVYVSRGVRVHQGRKACQRTGVAG